MDLSIAISNDVKRYVANLPVSSLLIDKYQRVIKQRRIKEILDNFNPNLFTMLLVSRRANGKYYIFDGGHRKIIAEILGMEYVDCLVHEGLSYEDEAKLYVDMNTNRGRVTALETFKARIEYRDETAIKLREILFAHGLKVSNGGGNTPYNVQAIGRVESVLNSVGEDALNDALNVITKAYNGHPKSLSGPIIYGISIFVKRYKGVVDSDRLMTVLSQTPIADLLRDGNAYSQTFGNSSTGIARSVRERYNRRLQYKLPEWRDK